MAWWIIRARRLATFDRPMREHSLRADLLLVPIAAYLGAAGVLQIALGVSGEEAGGNKLLSIFAGSGAQFVGLLAALPIAHLCFAGGLPRFFLGREVPATVLRRAVPAAVVAVALCNLVMVGTQHGIRLIWPDYEFPFHSVIEVLHGDDRTQWDTVLLWIGTAGVAPLAEEVFFRSLLQTYFVTLLGGRWRGIAAAALIFGLAHSQWDAMPALILLGMILGYLYERTEGLLAPVLVHAAFNLATLVALAAGLAG